MQTLNPIILAAKAVVIVALTCGTTPAHAGIPVIDVTNISQTTISAVKNTAIVLKQIEEYKTQLEQYQNMLQNTAAPAAYIWDQAQATISNLMGAIDTLNYYKQQLGSIDTYLSRFRDVSYYKASPCFSAAGCTPLQLQILKSSEQLGSEAQKKANDALFKGLDRQQTALRQDSQQLMLLQSKVQGATGQMQALQYANQLSSSAANQMLQIRGLLIAQQNAENTRAQAMLDKEALQEAASAQVRQNGYRPSPVRSY